MMNQQDWKNLFGAPPEEFGARVDQTLMNLEVKNMRKGMKVTTMLAAAALIAVLVMSAAFAAVQIDLFRMMETAEPIVPLEGAEELVETELAAAENEYFRVTVEQGIYDGSGVMLKVRVSPVNPEGYVIISDVAEGNDVGDEYVNEKRTRIISDSDENGEEYSYEIEENYIVGIRDGREIIQCSVPRLHINGEAGYLYGSIDFDEIQEDGSLVWMISLCDVPAGQDALEVMIDVYGYSEDHLPVYGCVEKLGFSLSLGEQPRRVKLVPVEGIMPEGFELLDAEILFTRVRGYITVKYDYNPVLGREISVAFRLYDADGNRIVTGSGYVLEEKGIFVELQEMQSFDPLPDTIVLEVWGSGEESILGRIECRLEEVAE